MTKQKLSPCQEIVLRFLGGAVWSAHPWWSVTAALHLCGHRGVNGRVIADRLVGSGLAIAESTFPSRYRISNDGLRLLKEMDQ